MLTIAGRAPKPNFARLGLALTCAQYWRAVSSEVSMMGIGGVSLLRGCAGGQAWLERSSRTRVAASSARMMRTEISWKAGL